MVDLKSCSKCINECIPLKNFKSAYLENKGCFIWPGSYDFNIEMEKTAFRTKRPPRKCTYLIQKKIVEKKVA